MPLYRAYIMGKDGHFVDAVNLDCQDDATAVASAKRLVNVNNFELWQQNRMITTLRAGDPE